MNMNFQRPQGLELRHASFRATEPSADKATTKKSWSKYAAWSLIAAGAVCIFASAGARALLIFGGVVVALAVLATFVCIRAQNETPYW